MLKHIDGIICDEDCTAVCSIIAGKLKIPMFYYRDKTKKWGKKNKIEGDIKVMQKCKNLYYLKRK